MNHRIENFAEFASRWKRTLSPESVARGKATGQTLAINRQGVSQGIYSQAQTDKDLAQGIKKGREASAAGKQAMLTKAKSSNRTMRPTTQRGNLKVKRSGNTLSPKSAQSFKQGAQNQAVNTKNARLNNSAKNFKDNVRFKTDLEDTINPPKSSNTGYQRPPKAPKIPKSSGGFSPKGFAQDFTDDAVKKVGGSLMRKKLAVGAGLAGVAAAGGLYAAKKTRERRQSLNNRFKK